jgi:hypothetical protein
MWIGTGGRDLGIERRTVSKGRALAAKFGGKFPCNLYWVATLPGSTERQGDNPTSE